MIETLLRRLAVALVSRPIIYGAVQSLAGQAAIAARLRTALAVLPHTRLLDVGSADGCLASRLNIDPVFVDLDPRPLAALRRQGRGFRVVAADAAGLPFVSRIFDASLCVAVSHHLDRHQLEKVIAELARVTSGNLVFVDALRNDRRLLSRWLWRFDRGRSPRTLDELRASLERRFRIREQREFTVLHEFVMWVASPL